MQTFSKISTNLCRDIDDGASNKKKCSGKVEYFRYDTGVLDSVSVYADGFIFHSKPAAMPAPYGAEPSSEEEFLAAWKQYAER